MHQHMSFNLSNHTKPVALAPFAVRQDMRKHGRTEQGRGSVAHAQRGREAAKPLGLSH